MIFILFVLVLNTNGSVEGHFAGEYDTKPQCVQAMKEKLKEALPKGAKNAALFCVESRDV